MNENPETIRKAANYLEGRNRLPTYVYECKKCQKQVELVQKISERVPPLCNSEECGSVEMESVIVGTSFALKGGGWYKDLYSSTKGK
jgi:putative FmdB family regulatory protein